MKHLVNIIFQLTKYIIKINMCDALYLFVCVLVITHLRFQTYKWKNSTLVALAIYWFLKHSMIFHTSGP